MIRRGAHRRCCCSSAWWRSPPACGASRRAAWCPTRTRATTSRAVILPDGATLQRTDKVVSEVVEIIKSNPANENAVAFTGFDFLGGGFRNNAATIFVTQKHWDERTVPAQAAGRRVLHEDRRTSRRRWCSPSTRRRSSAWAPPAASSSTSRTAARAAPQRLAEVIAAVPRRGQRRTRCWRGVQTLWRANVPQLYVDVDREKAKALGVPLDERLQHAGGHARHLLRQRLQQVRPHLAGADVGRAGVSASAPTTSARSTCARDQGEMVPLAVARHGASTRRARTRSTASTTCRR